MAEIETLLFANEIFYDAFSERDIQQMRSLWRNSDDILCIHPGWGALRGYNDVLESWTLILGAPAKTKIIPINPIATIAGAVGSVVCLEQIENNYLIATNLFLFEDKSWLMIHHHAGPTSAPERGHMMTDIKQQIH